jgi:hypothetical protein
MSGSWASGWVTGDIVGAAEFKKGIGAIYDTTLGSAASSIDISSIVTGYAHLRLVLIARGDIGTQSTTLQARLNNDSSTSYQSSLTAGNGSTVVAVEGLGTTSMHLGYMPAGTATANYFSSSEILIPQYAGTLAAKAVHAVTGARYGNATTNGNIYVAAGWWTTSAINRITLFPGNGNFVAGTRATLYVMGA